MKVKILDKRDNRMVDAIICQVTAADILNLKRERGKTSRFPVFDWFDIGRHSPHLIFKLEFNGEILGLLRLLELHLGLEINKLESSCENFGKHKRYDLVAGCLLAFAATLSYGGISKPIYLLSKKATTELYLTKYGFELFPPFHLVSNSVNNENLVSRYLYNDKQ